MLHAIGVLDDRGASTNIPRHHNTRHRHFGASGLPLGPQTHTKEGWETPGAGALQLRTVEQCAVRLALCIEVLVKASGDGHALLANLVSKGVRCERHVAVRAGRRDSTNRR